MPGKPLPLALIAEQERPPKFPLAGKLSLENRSRNRGFAEIYVGRSSIPDDFGKSCNCQ
jgi:hypothetical protein